MASHPAFYSFYTNIGTFSLRSKGQNHFTDAESKHRPASLRSGRVPRIQPTACVQAVFQMKQMISAKAKGRTVGYTSAKRGVRFFIAIFLAAGSLSLSSPDVGAAASFSVKHGQHPRLYTSEHRLNQIRAALKDDSSVIAQAWSDTSTHAHRKADELNAGDTPVDVYNANPNHLTGTAHLLGLGYHLTGDAKFSNAADRYIAQLVGVMPRSAGGDYSQGGRIEAMGLLYDWFFYQLSSYQKHQLATAIKETIPLLSDYICGPGNTVTVNWSCAVMPPYPKAVGGHSFENNKGVTAGLLAIVDEHPELMPLLAVQHENFSKNFDAVRAWVGMDGGYHMGWSYGSTY